MDYEKKYKEALKWMCKVYPTMAGADKEDAEHFFPELRESEDERIRKWLLGICKNMAHACKLDLAIDTEDTELRKELANYEASIIYLEKQKEQKPDTRDADDLQLLGFIYDLLNEIKWKDSWAMSKDECLQRLNNYRPQKPAWSKEDEFNLKSCIGKIEIDMQHWDKHGKTMVDGDIKLIDWLKSLPERFELQPKQEWSEREDKMLASAISHIVDSECFDHFHDITKEDIIDWLKSLCPQYRWKPSEQEKGALRTAIHILTEERNFPKAAAHLQNILDAFEGEEPRKEWKPSEEQMLALQVAAITSKTDFNILTELFIDLKKL